ncbi:FlxA-like family protein [Acidovorax sp. DW039]|uniref:hypothetical protein n=1 Tax=Acidovorax sp. DW039 TaxID=3095606 RepID=UPI00308901D1|nr:FlxA-like family protein [Acidovorax sp. DW039]
MNVQKLLLVTREGWFEITPGALVEIPALPRLKAPAVVVTDFDEAPIGVHRYEGKAAYAAPVIEKHARSQGLTEGAAHIVVHRLASVPGGCIALYTAVALDAWQRMQQWASQQPDHCIVVTLGDLLNNGLQKGQARVLRLGRTAHLVGVNESGVFHASVSAIGRSADDLEGAVRSLASQARHELGKGIKAPVQWGCALGADIATEQRLAAAWGDAARMECTLLPHAEMVAGQRGPVVSALPQWVRSLKGSSVQASPLAKLAWLSESLVAPMAGVTSVVGLGLLLLGVLVQSQAEQEKRAASTQLAQAQAIEARITQANKIEPSATFAPVAEFARQLGDGAAYDPVAMVHLVKQAAGTDIRIQRIRLEPFGNYKRTFRVDGVTTQGGLAAVSRFLSHTKAAGWRAEALDPVEQLPGAFSYRLIAENSPAT